MTESFATTSAVDSTETINELVARMPQALPVLHRFGLDTCCGGALSLDTAAQRHEIDLAQLLAALREAAEKARR